MPATATPSDLQRLRAALAKVAKLVIVDPAFSPIFARLEQEIALAEAEGDLISRARAVAARHSAMA
ncbi:hypothetical protein [Cypionkella psychrotolerans]|uniref:hypothetical protein n=1 Tax=Cypionkella psychrotolerans TaxID=1678131 RepID=UPI0006B66AF1|nr:hypothetical protein [Cypionkella psychrotolerans]